MTHAQTRERIARNAEKALAELLRRKYPDRLVTVGRSTPRKDS